MSVIKRSRLNPARILIVFYLLFIISLSGTSDMAFAAQVSVRVSADNDDAEERISDGDMYRDSTDLELGYDDFVGGVQIVGMRFRNVNIPQGAIINSAYLQFTANETDSGATNLIIYGENVDSANQFSNGRSNISSRPKTTASVTWTPAAWNNVNGLHQSPDIRLIIQEIVNRAGWVANNELAILIEPGPGCSGINCQRTADSHDGDSANAPLLVIDYSEGNFSGNLNVDNQFEAYISTDDSVQGTLIGSGTNWPTTEMLSAYLTPGQDYYLHIKATDVGGVAGFLGDFELSGTDHRFSNGLTTLDTNTSDWVVSTTGWGNYQPVTAYGTNVDSPSPWGRINGVSLSAQWIWSSNNDADNVTYFSTKIAEPVTTPIIEYRFDEASWNGSAGEVIDNLSLGLNGRALGNATTISQGQICSAGVFDGNGDYLSIPGLSTYLNTTASLSFWVKSRQLGNNLPWQAPGISGIEHNGGGDDIFWGYLDASGRIGIQKGNGAAAFSSAALNDVSWQHVVLTYNSSSGAVQVFVNGSLQGSAVSESGDVSRIFSSIGRIEASSGLNFSGQLDEVLIFDSVITANDVSKIFNHQSAGKNWDGSARVCPVVSCTPGLLNAVGVRIDTNGSNTQINTTTEALSIYNAWLAAGSPASGLISGGTYNVAASGSSTVDRIDFGGSAHDFAGTLPYPGAANGVGGTDFLVHTSGTVSLPAGDYTIFVEADDGFSFVMNTLSGDTVSFTKFGSSALGASNELRFENPTSNSNTGGSFTLTQDSVFDVAAIFYERGGSDFLEISIANDIRSSAAPAGYEIFREGALGGKVRFGGCPNTAGPDHYAISHISPGLTCEGTEVTVTAHDASHNAFTVGSDVVLAVSTSPSVDAILPSTITIPAGSSSASFFIQQTTPLSNIDIDVTDGTATDLDGDASEDPRLSFSDVAFRFYANGVASAIPRQVAGVNTAGQNLSLKAIKTDDESGACIPALQGPASTNVDIAYECNNPANCSSNGLMRFQGQVIAGDNQGNAPSYSSIPLVFDSNGEANFNFTFEDAGQITLRARKSVAANDPDPPFTLNGTSNAFWVRPFELALAAQASGVPLNGNSPNSITKHKAGQPFELIVRALNATGAVTPNYRPGQLQYKLARTGPSTITGSEGELRYSGSGSLVTALAGAASFQNVVPESFEGGSLGNGVSQYTAASYSEVGLINLDVQDINYGGSPDPIPGNAIDIGRFHPDYFNVTLGQANFGNACNSFTYLDQNFFFDTAPKLTIEARNVDGDITENYEGNFWKLGAALLEQGSCNGVSAIKGFCYSDNVAGAASLWAPNGSQSYGDISDTNGVLEMTLHALDVFRYQRPAAGDVLPFDADIQLTVELDDGEANGSQSLANIGFAGDSNSGGADYNLINDQLLRHGRWKMENAFGPETQNLAIKAHSQYFAALGPATNLFIQNPDDNCTVFTAADITLSPGGTNFNAIPVGSGSSNFSLNSPLILGEDENFRLSAPGSFNVGEIDIAVDLSAQPWLQYDWNTDGSLENHPAITASFGQYRGHDRIIYWREVRQ
jgi:MSHA biogenesis protein MshQ